ncbi:MAG: CD3324 family protein [Halanaerobiales bacterium]
MGYKNGKDVLPDYLLEEIQEYIQGELIYIPKEDRNKAKWGELSGARKTYQSRNKKIHTQYEKGASLSELMDKYCLSRESIRKIVSG